MKYIIKNINQVDNELTNKFLLNIYEEKRKKIKKIKNENSIKSSIIGEMLLNNLLKEDNINYNQLKFKTNSYGKPYITNNKIFFNISHSYDYVVVITSKDEIGVDIEKIREVRSNSVNYFATENEKKYIFSSNKDIEKRIFKIYTLKEAYFKMKGTNLNNILEVEFTIKNDKVLCNDKSVKAGFIDILDEYIISYCQKMH